MSSVPAKSTLTFPPAGSMTSTHDKNDIDKKLLFSREQDPREGSPLTYREYAFALPPGTSEADAADVLREELTRVQERLKDTEGVGKLVNLAAFDVQFEGKPPRRPIVTLTWKDWQGEAVLAYPARHGFSHAPAPPTHVPASLMPKVDEDHAAAALAIPPIPEPPKTDPGLAPPPPTSDSIPPPRLEARSGSNPGSMRLRTPSGRWTRGRLQGDDLITSLFEAMHDLHFLRDALEGGHYCLALAWEMLPSKIGLIHFYDLDKRAWLVACARGDGAPELLSTRAEEGDEILRTAAKSKAAVVSAGSDAARFASVGGATSVICAPMMQAGRALGAIELANPVDGNPFTADETNALMYIAEQYAAFLGSRGIVLDQARIRAAATM